MLKTSAIKKWTPGNVARLKQMFANGRTTLEMAMHLGRSYMSVKTKLHKLRLLRVKLWTAAEVKILKSRYGKEPARVIAASLGRNLAQIHRKAVALGLSQRTHRMDPKSLKTLRRMVAGGYCNSCIGRAIGFEKHSVLRWRRKLQLPQLTARGMVDSCRSCKERTRATTRQKIRKAGVKSLAEVRVKAFKDFARESGWPEDLRPRAVQILNALYRLGPMTRREICDAVGMPWKGSRKSLGSNDPEGSYLAHLAARGLVAVMRRQRKVLGQGKGRSQDVYAIPLHVKPTTEK